MKVKKYVKIKNIIQRVFLKNISNYHKTIEFKDDGTLNDKYYKAERLPNKISEVLIEPAQKLKDLVKDESKDFLQYIKQIFPDKEKEKAFLENKNLKFNLPRQLYKSFLEKGMTGDAIKFSHKNIDLCVIGTMYERINIVNLYKLLNLVKPDVILLQIRPDRLLSNLHKYYDNADLFLQKIIRTPSEIQPSLEVKENVRRQLMNKGFLINSKKLESQEIVSTYKEINKNQSERLTNEAISTISLWGEQKDTKIILSDLPETILMEKLANSFSLMQIRQMFEEIFTQFPNNPDWEPRSSLGTAINLFPDVFVHPSDAFIAHTINSLSIASQGSQVKALVFAGYGQTNSLPFYLNYDLDRNSLGNVLTVPPRYTSFIQGEDTLEIVAEKLCLLSLIFNGVEIEESNLQLVDNLIRKYCRDEMIRTGFNSENLLINRTKHLFEQLMNDKKEEALNLVGKGYEIKKKIFMRKIFNDPVLNSQLL